MSGRHRPANGDLGAARRGTAGSRPVRSRTTVEHVPHHDLVIIGTGSGNTIPDERFADLDVAIVETGSFGGTCLNVGCIPTKMYVYAADVAEAIRRAGASRRGRERRQVRWPTSATGCSAASTRSPPAGGATARRAGTRPSTRPRPVHRRRGRSAASTDGGDQRTRSPRDRIVVAAGSRVRAIPQLIASSGVTFQTVRHVMRIDDVPRTDDRRRRLHRGGVRPRVLGARRRVKSATRGPRCCAGRTTTSRAVHLVGRADAGTSSSTSRTARARAARATARLVAAPTATAPVESDVCSSPTGRTPTPTASSRRAAGSPVHSTGGSSWTSTSAPR